MDGDTLWVLWQNISFYLAGSGHISAIFAHAEECGRQRRRLDGGSHIKRMIKDRFKKEKKSSSTSRLRDQTTASEYKHIGF